MSFLRCLLLAALALTLSSCGGGEESKPAGGFAELDNVLDLRAAFEEDQGKTRVLAVFSPT